MPKIVSRKNLSVLLFSVCITAALAGYIANLSKAQAEGFHFNQLFAGFVSKSPNAFANLNLVITVSQDGLATLNTTADSINGRNVCPTNPTAGCDFSQTNLIVRTNDSIVYTYGYSVNGANEDVTVTATAPLGTVWNVLPAFCTSGSTLNTGNGTTTASIISCKRGVKAQGTSENLPFTTTVLGSVNNGSVLTASGAVSGPSSTTATANAANVTVTAAPHFNLRKSYQNYTSFTFNSVVGYRIEYRAFVEVFDDSVPAAYNPRYGSAALSSPITFTDVVSQISPNAVLESCAKLADSAGSNNGDGGAVSCSQSAAGQPIAVTVTGANTTLSQYIVPPSGGGFLTGTYRIFVFIPVTDVSNAPGQSLATTNTLTNFDPNSSTGQSNFDTLTESIGDNAVTRAITPLVGSFGKAYVKDYNIANTTSFGVAVGGDRFVASGEIFASQVSLNNNTTMALTNIVLCDVMDNSKYSVIESAPGSGIVYGNDTIAPTAVEFAAGYVNANWLPTATGGNSSGIRAECNDAGIVWYSNPTQVPGGLAAITKFRVKYDSLAMNTTGTVRVRIQARENNYYTSQTISNGAVLPNFATWRSDQIVPSYANNTYYQNVYPNSQSGSVGQRLFLARAIARITKETESNNTVNSVATGGTIGYVLKPTLATVGTPSPVQVSVLDVLPVGFSYVVGTGLQNSVSFEPQIINCTGNAAPDSHCTVAGQELLLWTLNNQTPNVAILPISFRAAADLTVANNQTVTNTAIVSSPADPSQEINRTATRNVTGASPSNLLVFKNTITPQIESNDAFRYTISYRNSSSGTFSGLDFIDVLPLNGDGTLNFDAVTFARSPASSFNGTRTVTSLSATTGAAVWYFTNAAPLSINISPKHSSNLNPGVNPSIWCAGTVAGPAAGCGFTLAGVTAIRLQDNQTMPVNALRTFDLNLTTSGNVANDRYTNNSGGSAAELPLAVSSNNVSVLVLNSSIGGSNWFDTNGDGVRGVEDTGRVINSNVILTGTDKNGSTVNRTTTTDAGGNYIFNNLVSGNYAVQFTRPTNYTASPQDAGSDDTADSDGNPTTLTTATIVLGVNEGKTNVDNGFYQLNLSGTVWNDANNNALLDNNESGINSLAIELLNSGGSVIRTTNTDSNGDYSFVNLATGDYRIRVTTSFNSSTATDLTPNDNVDNDDNGMAGSGADAGKIVSNIITLAPGAEPTLTQANGKTVNSTLDFGLDSMTTAVKLREFHVFENKGKTTLTWQTGFEVNNLGFRVYRQNGEERELLNQQLIAGSALTVGTNAPLTAGNAYNWHDDAVQSSANVGYILEAIDLDGTSEFFGPVFAEAINEVLSGEYSTLISELKSENSSDINQPLAINYGSQNQLPAKEQITKDDEQKINLAKRNALKIEVAQDGWYHVSRKNLLAAGITAQGNLANLQLFSGGAEQALKIGANGAIEFYGRGQDALQTDSRIYWLVASETAGKRITTETAAFDSSARSNWFLNSVERRDRTIRVSAILNGSESNFYAGAVTSGGLNQTLRLNEIALESGETASVEVNLQGLTPQNHRVEILLNGNSLGTTQFNGRARKTFSVKIPLESLAEGVNTVQLKSAETSDVSLLENIKIIYPRRFRAVQDRLAAIVPAGEIIKLDGFTSAQVRVLDVTDLQNVREFLLTGSEENGKFSFSLPVSAENREIVAEGTSARRNLAPRSLMANVPSDWRNQSNEADFLIIAPGEFHSAVEPLRKQRQAEGLETKIIDIIDIYDEFSDGARSADAVREFLRFAATKWKRKPHFVLLVGDASVDPRNFTGAGGAAFDQVPTMLVDTTLQEAASDEALVDFDADAAGEMAIGRIPVKTVEEAQTVIAKILDAENVSVFDVRGRAALFVSDSPIGYDFAALSENIIRALPFKMNVTRINRDDGAPDAVRERIITEINAGPRIVNFFGHGSLNAWTSAGVLRGQDVSRLNNRKALALMTMLSCLNGAFAETGNESLAETLIKSETGGGAAVWASTATTKGDRQDILASRFYEQILNGQRLGTAVRRVKNEITDRDIRQAWILFGDPTSRLFKSNSGNVFK